MAKGALVSLAYWSGDGEGAHIVRSHGVRVVLFYTPDGHPTMHVDRRDGTKPSEATEYEDDMMMRWNQAVYDQVRGKRAQGGS